MSALALKLRNVRKNFGSSSIINGLNLDVIKGERQAIIGPNGAGKSTLFNLISGFYQVSGGTIEMNGHNITNLATFRINRSGLSRSFQVTNIFPQMTVFENIRCGLLWSMGYKYSFWHLCNQVRHLNEKAEEILERIRMTQRRDLPAGLLAYAEQRALEIGITIAGDAEVILLDEPTAGMSMSETERAVELIRDVTENKTLLVVEHDMSVVFDLADRISVLVYGEIIATDLPEKIRQNQEVQEAYLGKETL
ncbi:MAG: ABC transporter ATP-binding protein [Proteobacteria bacterium]|nr:ABC transporter ATP-binding protein [Pseudomonadota bacterium]MBU1386761.1 ABC transporter ATP-binding protein [Pseudomonadota bacterium]MBU1544705.1 ABC transporter ATP-binding protein [Pseudomonadota bacterium]MBU2430111.1 ABC transporter ATP-binding protein [Pseudomonadota bacterium]MBU2481876.1 ABC transporter ATP-binding protein [Pseudomonadota bacterium]